jgi:hypothetical protein
MDRSQQAQELHASAAPVINELRISEFFDLADRLSACIALATTGDPDERTKALQEIQGLCHIKALGDTYVKRPTDLAWLTMLSQLSAAATCALNLSSSGAYGTEA